jgi:hypothetical protein
MSFRAVLEMRPSGLTATLESFFRDSAGKDVCNIRVLPVKKEILMTTEAHLTALETKHHRLEDEISGELHRPSPDQTRLTSLKREKLRIKEEISRLQD